MLTLLQWSDVIVAPLLWIAARNHWIAGLELTTWHEAMPWEPEDDL